MFSIYYQDNNMLKTTFKHNTLLVFIFTVLNWLWIYFTRIPVTHFKIVFSNDHIGVSNMLNKCYKNSV